MVKQMKVLQLLDNYPNKHQNYYAVKKLQKYLNQDFQVGFFFTLHSH